MSAPAKFNRDAVIEKAKNLYWEKGYHATSMRNLQEVIDMRPGSIYAAFGNKDNLFMAALDRYAAEGMALLADCVASEQRKLGALKRFLQQLTLANRTHAPSGMCMIVKSVAEFSQQDNPSLLAHATQKLAEVEQAFAKVFEQALAQGEFHSEQSPQALARYFQIQVIGLRTYAQATQDPAAIEAFITQLFTQWQR